MMKQKQVVRRIKANFVYPVICEPVKNGVLELDNEGVIVNITQEEEEARNTEYYNGVLVPGLINAHCHLELSHLKGLVPRETGLHEFVRLIPDKRNAGSTFNQIRKWDRFMYMNGIQAVGDVCNTPETIDTKLQSSITYINFIEVFGSDKQYASLAYKNGLELLDKFIKSGLSNSFLSPHSSYSLSHDLWAKLRSYWQNNATGIYSVHNQETFSEDKLFENGTGEMADLISSFGVDPKTERMGYASAIDFLLCQMNSLQHVLFVHNTFTKSTQIEEVKRQIENIFWVLCPSSNLYIENSLPDINAFINSNVCLGTDSLASNDSLSVLKEMQLIQDKFPAISFNTILKWATINGARALKLDNTIGSFEIGKKPGINLISGFDFKEKQLLSTSKIKRLV